MTTTIETPAKLPSIGLHRDVSYDDYARWDAVHHSILRHFNRTAAHAREAIVNPADSTVAQAEGWAAHLAVLDPDRFALECIAAPKFDKRTTTGKEGWAAFQAGNAGKTILTQDEHALCLRIRDAVWAHPTARELLMGAGANEVSALWTDADTGLAVKARLDRLTSLAGWPVVMDLKTARNASPAAFARDVHFFHYHQQGALYLDGCDALAPHPRKFVFVAVEKEPPYAVAVYELEQDAIDLGRDEYQKHLVAYARCIETNRWPGYPESMGYISVPSWAFKFHGEEA